MVQDAVPVLFRSESRRVPAEVIHSHGAVRDGLIGPEPHLPFLGLRRKSFLARLSRLLFHDHEGLATLHAAREVMSQGDGGRNEGGRSHPALLRHQHVEKAGVVVEGCEIQLLVQVAHVDRVHQSDIVGRDKMPRTRLAQHVQLFLLEGYVGVRLVAIVVESESWIRISA